jgi:hypothetical protein
MPFSYHQRSHKRRPELSRLGSRHCSTRIARGSRTEFCGGLLALFSSFYIMKPLFSSTRPKTLLSVAATVFLSAVRGAAERKLDPDVLGNGISYFSRPLLSWTLPGIVLALVREIRLTR